MNKTYGSSASARIDPQKLEKMKISFLFSFVLLISALLGMLVVNYISTEIYANSLFRLSNHFETVFLRCSDFVGYAKIIAQYSLYDIIALLIIFASSFSMLNYLLTDIVLFYSGIKFGISVAFLINFSKLSDLSYSIGNTRLALFVFAELAIIAIVLYYSCYSAMSSLNFRRTDTSGRPNIKTSDLISFAVKTAACVGATLILNTLYCFLLYILK